MIRLSKNKVLIKNIEKMEERRWRCVIAYRKIIIGPWADVFDKFQKLEKVWGYYEGKKIIFESDGYGVSHDWLNENSLRSGRFVDCLENHELPLYMNSCVEAVKLAVKERLEGKTHQAIRDDDLVYEYFKWGIRSRHILKAIEIYDDILKEHCKNVYYRMDTIRRIGLELITLTLNNRIYVFKQDEFIIKPEMENYQLSIAELKKKDYIDNIKTLIPNTIFSNFKPNG